MAVQSRQIDVLAQFGDLLAGHAGADIAAQHVKAFGPPIAVEYLDSVSDKAILECLNRAGLQVLDAPHADRGPLGELLLR